MPTFFTIQPQTAPVSLQPYGNNPMATYQGLLNSLNFITYVLGIIGKQSDNYAQLSTPVRVTYIDSGNANKTSITKANTFSDYQPNSLTTTEDWSDDHITLDASTFLNFELEPNAQLILFMLTNQYMNFDLLDKSENKKQAP